MIGCFIVGSKVSLLIIILNDMGVFFVFFYLFIDIGYWKFIAGKFRLYIIIIFCGKRVIYYSKVFSVIVFNVSLKCNGCGDWFVIINFNY